MEPQTPKCFILYTASRSEKKVEKRLKEQNQEVFLPLVTQVKQWSDRKKKVQVPLFNGYLFVYCHPDKRYEILQTPGAVKFVHFGGEPATVRKEEIEKLQRFIATGMQVEVTEEDFQPGDMVKIAGGALAGFEGECIARKNHQFLVLRIPSIGQSALISVETKWVVKAE
jgi:transcription termination/antitermination protein NusG